MSFRIFILAMLFLFIANFSFAQSSVKVVVKGLKNGDSAIVRIQTSQTAYYSKKVFGIAANADVNQTFTSLSNGKWSLSIDVNGYLSPSAKVLDLNNSSLQVDVTLTQSVNSTFTYQWEDDSSFVGHAQQSYINDAAVINILGVAEKVPSNFSALDLLNIYQFYLSNEASEWTPDEAYRLSQTISKFSFEKKYESQVLSVKAKWVITDLFLDNDIDIKTINGVDVITISRAAFTYATPLVVTLDGLKGTFFSKRLYAAILYYYTNKGTDITKINQISKDKFGLEFLEPSDLIQSLMSETKSNFQSFTVIEKLAILAMFEELPKAMQYDKGLKYLIRRINGQVDPHISDPAAAVAYPGLNLIEFMDKAFAGDIFSIQRLILHEKAHFLWANSFDNKTKDDWALLGSWFLDPTSKSGWSTTNTTEFVSAYAHEKNPNEDMAESISYYINNPDALRSRSIRKFEFIRDRIMQGTRYITVIRPDLTFVVYNLYPNYNYPGKIIRTKVEVTGAPTEDKIINIELELNVPDTSFQSATGGVGRLLSTAGTFFDIGFTPTNKLGSILKGSISLTKFAKSGYYSMSFILLYNALGDSRMENNSTYGMKIYVDNPLEDTTAPLYVNKTLKLDSVNIGFTDRGSGLKAFDFCLLNYRNDTTYCNSSTETIYNLKAMHIKYDVIEKNSMSIYGGGMGWAKAYINWPLNTVTGSTGQSMLDLRNDYGIKSFPNELKKVEGYTPVMEYFPTGFYTITGLSLMDIAGNERSVVLDNDTTNKSVIIDRKTQRGFRDSVYIKTPYPDLYPPILNLNNIKIKATPTQPTNPNGETKFEIWASVKDTSAFIGKASGIGGMNFTLRDPQGHEYSYPFNNCLFCNGGQPSIDKILNSPTRDGNYNEAYQAIILPVGSAPGLWGVSSLSVSDMAGNNKSYNFTEIVRFDVDTSTVLRVNPYVEILGKRVNSKNVDSVAVKIGCAKCANQNYRLTMYSSMGGTSPFFEGKMSADTIILRNLNLKGVNDGIIYATVQMKDSTLALIGTGNASYTKDVLSPKPANVKTNNTKFSKSSMDSLVVDMKVTELKGDYSMVLVQSSIAKGPGAFQDVVIKLMSNQTLGMAVGDSVVLTGHLTDSIFKLSNVQLSQFQDGYIDLKVVFLDSVGNESSVVKTTFYKDTKDPIITIKQISITASKALYTVESNEYLSNTLTASNISLNSGTVDSLVKVSNLLYNLYFTRACNDSVLITFNAGSAIDTVGNKNIVTTLSSIEKIPAIAAPIVSNITYCSGAIAAALSATNLTGNSLLWYGTNAAGGTSSGSAPTPSTINVGTFNYYVSQKNSSSICESPRTALVVTVNALPTVASITGATALCAGTTTTLSNTTTGGLWTSGTTANVTISATGIITGITAGTSIISYTVTNANGCVKAVTQIDTVNAIPAKPSITRDVNNNLVSSAILGNQWYSDTTAIIAGQTTQSYKPSVVGYYAVKLTLNNCSSPFSDKYYYLVTALANLTNGQFIHLYPNPTSNDLIIDYNLTGQTQVSVKILDVNGIMVINKNKLSKGSKVGVTQLIRGIYFVQVIDKNNQLLFTDKLIKQ